MLSIVIASWNTRPYLEVCLASLRGQTCRDVEIIVVDNGSRDGTVPLLRKSWPDVRLVENARNEGFARANNQGLAAARGEFLLFLNADTVLDDDALERAVGTFAEDEAIGAVAPKLLRFDGETLDSAGQFLSRTRKVRERGYGERDRGQFDRAEDVFSVCGAAAFWRREAVEDVSVEGEFFDEDFFSYWEDLDAGWRARRRGWRVRYNPAARIRHARGGAFASGRWRLPFAILRRSAEFQHHILKNRYLTLIKNDSWGALLHDLPHVIAGEIAVRLFLLTHPRHLLKLLEGAEDYVPRALARRRALREKPTSAPMSRMSE
jgi:GT2 family glycosyltransferase